MTRYQIEWRPTCSRHPERIWFFYECSARQCSWTWRQRLRQYTQTGGYFRSGKLYIAVAVLGQNKLIINFFENAEFCLYAFKNHVVDLVRLFNCSSMFDFEHLLFSKCLFFKLFGPIFYKFIFLLLVKITLQFLFPSMLERSSRIYILRISLTLSWPFPLLPFP